MEYDKVISYPKEFVLDELDLQRSIEPGAIWEPVFLDEGNVNGDFSGILLSDEILWLGFSVLVCQNLARILQNGLSIMVKRIDDNREMDDLLQAMVYTCRYVVVLSEEYDASCFYVG